MSSSWLLLNFECFFRGPGSSYSGKFNTLHVEVFFFVSLSPLAPSSALGHTIHYRLLLPYYWTCTFTKVLLQLDYTSLNRLLPTCLGQQLNMLRGKPWHPYQLLSEKQYLCSLDHFSASTRLPILQRLSSLWEFWVILAALNDLTLLYC